MMKQLRGRNLAHPGCLIGLTLGLIIGITLAGILAVSTKLSYTAVILVWASITLVLAVSGWMTGSRLSSKFSPLEEDAADAASALPGTQNDSTQS